MIQNGTITAHGKTWPLYEHTAFSVEVNGSIPVESADSLEAMRDELDSVLNKYGVEAQIRMVQVLSLSPDDQAEKEALDAQAVKG